MTVHEELDRIAISVKSHKRLKALLRENPKLEEVMRYAKNETEALVDVRNWVLEQLQTKPNVLAYYEAESPSRQAFEALDWSDYAAIRILDYVGNAGRELLDLNLRGELAVSNPVTLIWLAVTALREKADLPFLATDRSVINLPAVGKSLTFRVIGVTRYGRRIIEFDHDRTRAHSPIIDRMGKVVVIESKSIGEYLEQLNEMGEDVSDLEGIYGYSLGQTEPRMPLFDYPEYDFQVTEKLTNLRIQNE